MNLVSPMFFNPNRVSSPFKGGRLLDYFLDGVPKDSENLSEEWFASAAPSPDNPEEGVSEIIDEHGLDCDPWPQFLTAHGDSVFGPDYILQHGRDFPLQCRLIDSSERRGIQFTPNTDEFPGKPKAWIIVDAEESDDKEPTVLIGFKDGVAPEDVVEATKLDDGRLELMMHCIPAKPGDAFFIPPGVPHAIGAGMLVYEIQPTGNQSFYIENKFRSDDAPWALSAPEVVTHTPEDFRYVIQPSNHMLKRSDEGFCGEVVGSHQTDEFKIWHAEVVSKMEIKVPAPFAMVLCTGGEGNISYAGGTREIKKGDFFVQPFGVPWIEYHAHGRLSLTVTMPKN
ncbi:MAG: hypothetical protein KAR11_01635 [Phycisphaerae bacterium]|nr:hypothetical protein [Phycisphaerae bacterium]